MASKITGIAVMLCLIQGIIFSQATIAQPLAFPGALGGGKYTTGGRGGEVYQVTNLNDSGTGSLRDAVSKPNRTIVFRVSGVIELKSRLVLRQPNITIAGQTAPGQGICLANYATNISANNIIIRYIRFRHGDAQPSEDDALNCFSGAYRNIIIDHCSMSWSVDETTSFYDVKNVTLQWNIISESLYSSIHSKGNHGYAGIFGGANSSYLFNLIAHHTSRTPRFNGTRYNSQTFGDSLEFCNNVIYNWGSTNSAYGGEGGKYNMINNYYKAGPATPGNLTSSSTSNKRNRILNYSNFYVDGTDTIWGGDFYINGNYVHGYPDVTADNWTKGVQKTNNHPDADRLIKESKQLVPYKISDYVPIAATSAYDSVARYAGAILPERDPIDARIIREMLEGKATYEGAAYKTVTSTGVSHPSGIIDKPSDVGGFPSYKSATAPLDSDKDGMPDAWELSRGLNPDNANDRNTTNSEGYTMLEVYLNGLQANVVSSIPVINADEARIKIYPNPTKGLLNIHNLSDTEIEQLFLYDFSGRQVDSTAQGISKGQIFEMNLSRHPKGTYLLKLISKGVIYSQNIVKQ